jgi:hypothetical protein
MTAIKNGKVYNADSDAITVPARALRTRLRIIRFHYGG